MQFLKQFFTWWNGQTLNTRFYTWRKGNYVGQDELGNRYYKAKSAVPDSIPERRWVIYKGYSEASQVGPGWHGWLHHRTDVAPPQENYVPRDWQKPHEENLTGSAGAYHPPGSIAVGGKPVKAAADYQAWKPQ
ncbi:MAG: NADH:ubiquinone oxidoreductase subunit NDUFA12 [Pseudomonadota bacterium]|nr:NADH:ubiquinone oxidoreductase subunit NDUFA12 [Pseudomonadota bacterium]